MAKEVYMPALGMNQETGTLLRWFRSPGEEVRAGDPLMEISTDKTDVEIEAPASGVLHNVLVGPGDIVPVGQVIAVIVLPGEDVPPLGEQFAAKGSGTDSAPRNAMPEESPGGQSAPVSPVAARMATEHGIDLAQVKPAGNRVKKEDVLAHLSARSSTPSAAGARQPASPKARQLASQRNLDLSTISGSGPGGAVLTADVLSVAEQVGEVDQASWATTSQSAPIEIPVSRMWKVMAERLTQSWTSTPHFGLERDVDAERLMAWRGKVQAGVSIKVTYTDLLVKVVATALRAHPRLNASWRNERIIANGNINVGIAIAVEEGLLVPVIHDADATGLDTIAAKRADLVERASNGSLGLDDLDGGTFTISNLGMYGVDRFSAIVNPPQAAILAVGRIVERVVPVNGQPQIRPMFTLKLSCDHRVVDGARASQFLDLVATYVEEPLRLLS